MSHKPKLKIIEHPAMDNTTMMVLASPKERVGRNKKKVIE